MTVSGLPTSSCFLDDGVMSDWQRLGKYVLSRRVEMGYSQREEFASVVGVSSRVISDIENGRRSNFDAVTIAKLERALDWETGSALRVARGGEPMARRVAAEGSESPGHGGVSEEIEMIYASPMTPRQKLEAIRMVLDLGRQLQAEAETAQGQASAFNATVEISEG